MAAPFLMLRKPCLELRKCHHQEGSRAAGRVKNAYLKGFRWRFAFFQHFAKRGAHKEIYEEFRGVIDAALLSFELILYQPLFLGGYLVGEIILVCVAENVRVYRIESVPQVCFGMDVKRLQYGDEFLVLDRQPINPVLVKDGAVIFIVHFREERAEEVFVELHPLIAMFPALKHILEPSFAVSPIVLKHPAEYDPIQDRLDAGVYGILHVLPGVELW